MKGTIAVFTLIIVSVAGLLLLSKYTFISATSSFDIIIALIALFFLFIGIFISKGKTHSNSLDPIKKQQRIKQLEITEREYEVLQKIALGLSNKEIADQLFLTESTVKSHVSNLFIKLNSKRRTEAIKIAQELHII